MPAQVTGLSPGWKLIDHRPVRIRFLFAKFPTIRRFLTLARFGLKEDRRCRMAADAVSLRDSRDVQVPCLKCLVSDQTMPMQTYQKAIKHEK
jgi:hypothetical protein